MLLHQGFVPLQYPAKTNQASQEIIPRKPEAALQDSDAGKQFCCLTLNCSFRLTTQTVAWWFVCSVIHKSIRGGSFIQIQLAGVLGSPRWEPLEPDFSGTWSNSSSSCLRWKLVIALGSRACIDVTLRFVGSYI